MARTGSGADNQDCIWRDESHAHSLNTAGYVANRFNGIIQAYRFNGHSIVSRFQFAGFP